MSPMPLDGVTVLDATQVMAGPFCTLLLADMGADVIKVEKPSGDDSRFMGPPFINGESLAFLGVNRNKRSIVLNLEREEDREAFRTIARQVDVVAENFRPGTMERLGLGAGALMAQRPELIYVAVSGFGRTGPYSQRPGYDLVAQGMSGIMSVTGHPGSPPVKVSVPVADLNAGLFAAYGVLAAYIHRLKTGHGQVVDTSLLDSAVAYTMWEAAELWGSGATPEPRGSAHRLVAPYQAVRSADGYFNLGVANQAVWERFCRAAGLDRLLSDDRFATNAARTERSLELAEEIERTTVARTSAEWLALFEQAGVPAGPIYDMAQVFADPQVLARDMVQTSVHPVAGEVRHIGNPVKLSETPASNRRPAPTLGQHTQEVLRAYGLSEEDIARIVSP